MSANPAEISPLPLDTDQTRRVTNAISGLSREQMHWVSGYIAGLAANRDATVVPAATETGPQRSLTVLYGSQTGNGERVAKTLMTEARARGFAVTLKNLADYRPKDLRRESLVTLVVSTHGDGDPPDDAEPFVDYIASERASGLEGLRYTVLALGDSSYANFCETGRTIDTRLAELGATRIADRIECDLDFEMPARRWTDAVLDRLPELLPKDTGQTAAVPHIQPIAAVPASPRYDRQSPYRAEVMVNQPITAAESSKDVRHIELSLRDSGIHYQPGDALAVIAHNPPVLVEEFMDVLELEPGARVDVNGDRLTLREALSSRLEITALSVPFLKAWAAICGIGELDAMLADDQQSQRQVLIETHQVIDVVRRFRASVDAQGLVDSLRYLAPRAYSIASSQRANPDEVHLTVTAVRYEAFGRPHEGAASTFLADRVAEGDFVDVYVQPNPRFRLPEDDSVPVIMIGPGTGVAPFRAFVEERKERGADGDTWLFFGDREFRHDFLYHLEWRRHLRDGSLTRLDVAFSRDQSEKVYVQDRLREGAVDVYAWIERGAAIYVCGDAKRMAADVHNALVEIVASGAGIDPAAAEDRLKAMRRAGRYQKDVY